MILNTNLGAVKDYSLYEDDDQYLMDEEGAGGYNHED